MKSLKLIAIAIAIAISATAFAAPAFAGPDSTQQTAQKRAYERALAQNEQQGPVAAQDQKAVAGSTGPQTKAGSSTPRVPASPAIGHPTERVRR